MDPTRRDWLLTSIAMAALAEAAPAQEHSLDLAEIEAIAAEIIPSIDGPGAQEAGVIVFIDRALSTFDAGKREAYRTGMAQVQQKRAELFPASHSIAGLTPDERIALIHAIETWPFFEMVRTHTLMGFLGNPSYGGNRGKVGWKHIGFEHRMAFQPPFGYYNAPENR